MKKNKYKFFGHFVMIALLFVIAACGNSSTPNSSTSNSPTPAPQVKLGEVTLVVPYSPGGGFDLVARTIAPYLEKNLPEGTKIIIENKPGGNGVIGVQKILTAKPDGKTIGIFNMPGILVEPILGNADFDLTKVEWIGQASSAIYVAAASPKSGIINLEGLKAQKVVKGGMAGLTDTSSVGALAAADALGFKMQSVAHKGSTEAILSAIRGDTQFVQYGYDSLKNYIVNSKDLVPLWVYSNERLPQLPNVPTIIEMGHPELLEVATVRRLIGTAPGTPAPVLKVLRDALEKTLKDPELLKVMNDGNMEPRYLNAEKSLESVKSMKELMEKHKQLFIAK